jgi:hypothetical protein
VSRGNPRRARGDGRRTGDKLVRLSRQTLEALESVRPWNSPRARASVDAVVREALELLRQKLAAPVIDAGAAPADVHRPKVLTQFVEGACTADRGSRALLGIGSSDNAAVRRIRPGARRS